MSPSNTSRNTDQKHKAIAVAMEEKSATNNPREGSTQEVVPEWMITDVPSERKITDERLSFRERVVQEANSMMTNDPPRDNIPLPCNLCDRRFATTRSLHSHQRMHRLGQDLERQLKKTEPSYSPGQALSRKRCNPYQDPSDSVDFRGYSKDTSSNDKHLGISRDPSEFVQGDGSRMRSITFPTFSSGFTRANTDNNMAVGYPVAPYGNTSHGYSSGTLLVTQNNNSLNLVLKERLNNNRPILSDFNHHGLSLGPVLKSRGDGSSSDYPSLFNRQVTMPPPATPHRPLTENTSYGSSSKVPLPSSSYSPHALSLELSLRPANDVGSSSNNNSSSRGSLSLELSLGPPTSTGGSKSNSSGHPSLNGGVTGRGLMDLNMPVRPRVSRKQYHSYCPLDSITRNVPLPPPPPPPTTNFPNDENASGSRNVKKLIAKVKTEVVELDDTDDEN